jgi:glycosyltransferase involved in cell wall biosynthesis
LYDTTLPSLCVLIPAYNPTDALVSLTDELLGAGFDVLVVDDGSGEESREIFASLSEKANFISYPDNKGKGAALKCGIAYITESMPEISGIITADADGQHDYESITRVADAFVAFPDKLILGSRAFDKDVPARSAFGNSMTRVAFSISTSIKVYDTQTGLRAFSVELARDFLEIEGSRYEFEIEMLLFCARNKIGMHEITIKTIYLNENKSSSFKSFRDSFLIYKHIIKFSLTSLISFGTDYLLFAVFMAVFGAILPGFYPKTITSFANITARIFSGSLNYLLNRKVVFKRSGHNSLPKYICLATSIIIINTLFLNAFMFLGVHSFAAKLIVEVLLFTANYFIQKKLIFTKKKVQKNES